MALTDKQRNALTKRLVEQQRAKAAESPKTVPASSSPKPTLDRNRVKK